MRRPKIVKESGPYEVKSFPDGHLEVLPAWPQFTKWTAEEGGGPGFISRMGLAEDMERWLNAPYREEA